MTTRSRLNDFLHHVGCARRQRQLVSDLADLSDRQLEDIGTWRGALRDTAAGILARQGCPRRDD